MNVLVACEESGTVRDAFARRGHNALSVDLRPTRSPGPHIEGDVLQVIRQLRGIDLMIAHPPCTDLAVSGSRHFWRKEQEQLEALDFVSKLMNAPIPAICIENPVSIISSQLRKPDQIIQPWYFGDPEQKTTCLWLKGLLPLRPTHIVQWGKSSLHNLPPSKDRARIRSKTFLGLAEAMAAQWGDQEYPDVELSGGSTVTEGQTSPSAYYLG